MDDKTKRILYYALGIAFVVSLFKKGSSVVSSAVTSVTSALNYKDAFKQALIGKALDIQKRLGIDPNLLITQSALESNWGRSGLTKQDNNYFGMTAGSWLKKGLPVSDWPTTEWVSKPVDQVTFFETPGDLISKEAVSANQTKVKVHRYFRHYGSMEESLDDWANLISGLSLYANAYAAAKVGDVDTFAASLQSAGYATDPKYAMTLKDFYDDVSGLA